MEQGMCVIYVLLCNFVPRKLVSSKMQYHHSSASNDSPIFEADLMPQIFRIPLIVNDMNCTYGCE